MKKVFLLLAVFFLLVSPSYAFTGLGLGVRAGVVSNYDNPKLGDFIKEMNMFGGHLKIGALPIIDLEISGEYLWKTKEATFALTDYFHPLDEDPYGSDTMTTTVKFEVEDYSLNATAKYVLPTSVIKPYIGAGGGLHFIRYKYTEMEMVTVTRTETKPSYHLNAGVLLDVPVLPLEAFVEGRYTSIQTEKKATGFFTWMLGVTLTLP